MDRSYSKIKLRENLNYLGKLQSKENQSDIEPEITSSEIRITMSRGTLAFFIFLQIFLIILFFFIGFTLSWSYMDANPKPAETAMTKSAPVVPCEKEQSPVVEANSIINDMEKIN